MFYEPAEGERPREEVWSTRRYLATVPDVLHEVRAAYGPDLNLLHDVHHRLTPIEAARLGRMLEPVGLFWLEDPVPAELQANLRLVRSHTTTPLAIGEVFNSIWDCQQLISEQLIDFIRMSVVHSGGITHLRRILHLAELYRVRSGCHGATDLSPSAWPRRCTSTSPSPTSGCRSTCATAMTPIASSRTATGSATGCCTPVTSPGWE
jgi:mannonate dehydratase